MSSSRIASPLRTLIAHELRTLRREGTFSTLLGIFSSVTLFSVFIGWSTRSTTIAIYAATVTTLKAAGVSHIAPNPLLGVSTLSIFNNLIIYTLLVGALLAIVIGHRSFVRDRKSGVVPLLLSRPAGRPLYIAGKLCGISAALLFILFSMFVVSALSTLLIPALHLSGGEFLSLAAFYTVSFLYLAFFAALGLLFGVYMSNESLALLAPVLVWIAVVFILPELSTGQNPVSLLNPVTLAHVPSSGTFFSSARAILSPFSFGQDYTALALHFLRISPGALDFGTILKLLVASTVAGAASMFALQKYSTTADQIA
ncbi:MAG: ABC transporter permease subunit [Patescibacteria group bacterium]|nr:ABC transporter permease subunit [Patescibacteria group bacterium]